MPYKFLILDTYYPEFLNDLYRDNVDLAYSSYHAQKESLLAQAFGTGDFYSKNLQILGCEAEEIIANNFALQAKWAEENQVFYSNLLFKLSKLRKIGRFFPSPIFSLVKEQIKRARPDVLYVQHIAYFPPEFLFEVKQYTKLLVGQIASDHPPVHFYKPYDLVLTSLPNFLAFFKEHQIPAEYFKIAFEPNVLGKAKPQKLYDCTFVGGFGHHHRKGREHLEAVARALPLALFGPNLNGISTDSPLKDCYKGPAWGRDMYNILQSSKIGLNRHADFAGDYANNMRLYEVTGSGALLITDAKSNMSDLFEVGKEVLVYNNADELIDLVRYYLTHDQEREAIAKAGQKRTLQEHTYFHRMQELVSIVDRYV